MQTQEREGGAGQMNNCQSICGWGWVAPLTQLVFASKLAGNICRMATIARGDKGGSNGCQRGTGLHFGVAIGQFNSIDLLHNFLINSFSTHLTPHFDFCCLLPAFCFLLPTPAPRSAANGLDVINKPTINKYGQGGAQLQASTINNEIIFTKLASSLLGVRSFSRFPVSLFSRTQASENFLWKTKTAAHFTPM